MLRYMSQNLISLFIFKIKFEELKRLKLKSILSPIYLGARLVYYACLLLVLTTRKMRELQRFCLESAHDI